MFEDFINLLFPETCVCCEQVLSINEPPVCHSCFKDLPIVEIDNLIAYNKLVGRVNIQKIYSYLKFNKGGKSQKILHELKYRNNPELGIYIGKSFANYLKEQKINLEIDYLLPVPLHHKRLKSRGYNQAEAIAIGFAEVNKLTLDKSLLKTKEASTQIKKGRTARLENMQDCFSVLPSTQFQGKHIGILDDVITTGATLESCCMCLAKAGVEKITVLSLAVA